LFFAQVLQLHPLHSDTKNCIGAYAPDIYLQIYWYEKTTQKNSGTEQRAFRYRCYALYSIFGVSLENDAEKHFMLRKWQHGQVAPLAIQTPT